MDFTLKMILLDFMDESVKNVHFAQTSKSLEGFNLSTHMSLFDIN